MLWSKMVGMLCNGEQRTQQLRSLPTPRSIAELRRPGGLFAYVARPMYDLVSKPGNKEFKWNGV